MSEERFMYSLLDSVTPGGWYVIAVTTYMIADGDIHKVVSGFNLPYAPVLTDESSLTGDYISYTTYTWCKTI